jgi:hypothetical protein
MTKWRIHKEKGRYIPQRKWFFFWLDIVLPSKIYHEIKDKGYKFFISEKFDSYGGHYYCYRPEFETMEGAIYCAKMYDEYYKKEEDEQKIKDYYLNENYEVKL